MRARRDAFDVHDGHDAADDRRKLHESRGLEVLRLQRHVGRAEVDGLGLDLGDAAARADGLIVHSHAGLLLVGFGPLGVDRVRKRRAGAGDVDRRSRWKCRTRSSRRPGSLGSDICACQSSLSIADSDCRSGVLQRHDSRVSSADRGWERVRPSARHGKPDRGVYGRRSRGRCTRIANSDSTLAASRRGPAPMP